MGRPFAFALRELLGFRGPPMVGLFIGLGGAPMGENQMFIVGQNVKVVARNLDDSGYADMRQFDKKSGVVVGIGNVVRGLVQVQVGRKFLLLPPVALKAA